LSIIGSTKKNYASLAVAMVTIAGVCMEILIAHAVFKRNFPR